MKAELKRNNVNQIIKGTNIFEAGDEVTEIGLVIKTKIYFVPFKVEINFSLQLIRKDVTD